MSEDAAKLHFWQEAGRWYCAVPRDDFATRAGLHWKKYGVVGMGMTRQEALGDWHKWKRAVDFVSGIY